MRKPPHRKHRDHTIRGKIAAQQWAAFSPETGLYGHPLESSSSVNSVPHPNLQAAGAHCRCSDRSKCRRSLRQRGQRASASRGPDWGTPGTAPKRPATRPGTSVSIARLRRRQRPARRWVTLRGQVQIPCLAGTPTRPRTRTHRQGTPPRSWGPARAGRVECVTRPRTRLQSKGQGRTLICCSDTDSSTRGDGNAS